jgi:hypothetical protein
LFEGRGIEGEIYIIKNNVLRDDDVVGGEIKTLIIFVVSRVVSFMVSRVSEKNTSGGLGASL